MGSPQGKQSVTICNIEPSIKPPILSKPKKVTTARENVFSAGLGLVNDLSSSSPKVVAPPVADVGGIDVELVMACVPEPMRTLDAPGILRVWKALKPLLDGGALPSQIRDYLNSGKLPDQVAYMPGLIASRLARMALPKASTRGLRLVSNQVSVVPESAVVELTPEQEAVGRVSKRVLRSCGDLPSGALALITHEVISNVCDSRGWAYSRGLEACLVMSLTEFSALALEAKNAVEKRTKKVLK